MILFVLYERKNRATGAGTIAVAARTHKTQVSKITNQDYIYKRSTKELLKTLNRTAS